VFPPAVPPNAAGQLVDRPPGEAGGEGEIRHGRAGRARSARRGGSGW
jgi:hypothetical protein